MTTPIKLLVITILLTCAFFAGVKNSDTVKSHASWIFESKSDEEVELPDLSGENDSGEIGTTIDENGENLSDINPSQDQSPTDIPPSNSETNQGQASAPASSR